jgi:hypothetical protein
LFGYSTYPYLFSPAQTEKSKNNMVDAVFPSVMGVYLIIFKTNFNMKKKLESIKDLKFQALEKNQMMKILGGAKPTDGGSKTFFNGDTMSWSSDTTNDAGDSTTYHQDVVA